MDWEEEVEHKKQAQKYIDDILREFDGNFVSPADLKFLNEQKDVGVYSRTSELADKLPPYSFMENKQRIISKIVSHARYFKDNGEVRYNINGLFLEPEEVRNLLAKYSGDPLISSDLKKYVQSFIIQYDNLLNLSSKQVVVIENITNYCDEFDRHQNLGVVRLKPGKDPIYMSFVFEFVERAINYALGKGKKTDEISTDDLLKFRKRFVTPDGVDLSSLRDRIEQTTAKQKTFNKYDKALSILQDFLNSADPAKYNYNGVNYGETPCARPKILE